MRETSIKDPWNGIRCLLIVVDEGSVKVLYLLVFKTKRPFLTYKNTEQEVGLFKIIILSSKPENIERKDGNDSKIITSNCTYKL